MTKFFSQISAVRTGVRAYMDATPLALVHTAILCSEVQLIFTFTELLKTFKHSTVTVSYTHLTLPTKRIV